LKEYFTVKSDGRGGFKINVGVGRTFKARDLQEVVYGLEHYFRKAVLGFSKEPFNYEKHIAHAKECDCCPLCREK